MSEVQCYREIKQPGCLIRIKAPQGFGKTKLLKKILKESEQREGYKKVYLELKPYDKKFFNEITSFLIWFCERISRRLKLSDQISHKCQNINNISQCKDYFEDFILSKLDCPLVLGLDAVDNIFPYSIAEEFLSMLRSWCEEAGSYEIWNKFRLIIAYSTDAYIYIPFNVRCSPFNIGFEIELPEFTIDQIKDLAAYYELEWKINEVRKLTNIVGGNPKLIILAINKVLVNAKSITIDEILDSATKLGGVYYDHLTNIQETLEKYKYQDLISAMRKITNGVQEIEFEDKKSYFLLYSLGLVKQGKKGLMPRCELYQKYFSNLEYE